MQPKEEARVLVFPYGSEAGLEVFRSLARDTHIRLYGASGVSSNHGRRIYANYTEGLPCVTDPGFVDAMNSLLRESRIDLLVPTMDSLHLEFAACREQLACKVVGSPPETCRTCCSRRATYETLSDALRVPALYDDLDRIPKWPVSLTPDCSYDSRGVITARSREEARFFLGTNDGLLATEYLPGRQYTVDCFTDRHGVLLFAGPRECLRIRNGNEVGTRPVKGTVFQELAAAINAGLTFRGAWFFQLKESDNGMLTLLEVAPRAAGAMALYRNLGVNLPLLSVLDAMDMDVSIQVNDFEIEIDRVASRFRTNLSYNHVYIDLDDCVICDGLVNTEAAAFLYQCVNRGIVVHLLTRHAGSVEETLKQARLSCLFDEIIHLRSGELKSDAVKHADAIFIDDSFGERRDVREKKGIPVFAPDAIECLME